MFDLTRFGLSDTFEVSAAVPQVAADATSLQEAAARIVRYFYDHVVDKHSGDPSLALVQCFASTAFHRLPAALQDVAATSAPATSPHPRQLCLTLLAAAGDPQAVSDTRIVRELATLPLPSPEADVFAPLAAHLVQRVHAGDEAGGVLRKVEGSYAIGLVSDVRGCVLHSAWSGVAVAYGIRSALALVARVGPDVLVTLIAYAKGEVPQRTADAFSAVAIGLKLAAIPHVEGRLTLTDEDAAQSSFRPNTDGSGQLSVLRAQNDALHELLRVRHDIALDQSGELEQALQLSESRATELAASQAALARTEARASAIVATALDAVVVMDAGGRVVDWNRAAEATFGYSREEAVGELIAELIVPDDLRDRHTRGIRHYLETGEGPLLGNRVEITGMRRDGSLVPVELTITPVHSADGSTIFTGFVRDITERRDQRAALLASRENYAHIARTLQRSLLPAALPQLPGLDLGAVFHPSRAGSDVGGDFYDVFRLGRTDLLLGLGDVCGKGAEAASITAIARHTTRAVAMDLRHPSAILRRLNSALLDQDIGERFCSMVAARAVPIVRGLRLSVCCAGHAPPMVVRADGPVERVGVPGDLLGLFPEVRLHEETVQLAEGDTFVLFTDGVTEAVRSGQEFGEERLAAALVEARAGTATEMVNHVLDAVLAFGGEQPRDDIAMLAVRSVPRQSTD